MMYSEFLEMTDKSEKYISFAEYTTLIEPIYTECELSKADFIALMEEAFNKIVYPAIGKAIHNLSIGEKLSLMESSSAAITNELEKIDFEARKIAYQYMKLYSKL